MLSAGLKLTVPEILLPLKNIKNIMSALLVNFIAVPLMFFFIVKLFGLQDSYSTAFILLGAAAGAPLLPTLSRFAKSSLAYAIGLMVLLMAATVAFLPFLLKLMLPGTSSNTWEIAKTLIFMLLLPIAAGVAFNTYFHKTAVPAAKFLTILTDISILTMTVLGFFYMDLKNNTSFPFGRITAVVIIVISLSMFFGFLFGIRSKETRTGLSLGTGQRNISAALVIASRSFSDPDIQMTILVYVVVSSVIMIPYAFILGRLKTKQEK
jgi:BASS family bile acid:Na+ symporter